MAGVLCAYFLTNAGVDCVLAEGNKIGSGVTGNTTAVLTAQHDTLYQTLVEKLGADTAKSYLQANLWAVNTFRQMAKKYPCQLETLPSVQYSLTNAPKMKREAEVLASLGYRAEYSTSTPLPFPVAGAVLYPDMAQFHPMQFLYGVAKNLNIYENTYISKLHAQHAQTKTGLRIKANKIIVATHFPFINRLGLFPAKLYQMRSYVLALQNAPRFNATFTDEGKTPGFYFRNYGNLLLMGGFDYRVGKGCGFTELRRYAKEYFPQATETACFAAQDCMSLDGLPYVGPYSRLQPNWYTVTGFNEWGMTNSLVAAKLLCDRLTGVKNPWARTYSPQRSLLHVQLLTNLGETVKNLCKPTMKRCSHLGCGLTHNSEEQSWDCPCHGSRFTDKGEVLENPAMKNIHV